MTSRRKKECAADRAHVVTVDTGLASAVRHWEKLCKVFVQVCHDLRLRSCDYGCFRIFEKTWLLWLPQAKIQIQVTTSFIVNSISSVIVFADLIFYHKREMKIQMDDLSKKIRVLQEDVLLKRYFVYFIMFLSSYKGLLFNSVTEKPRQFCRSRNQGQPSQWRISFLQKYIKFRQQKFRIWDEIALFSQSNPATTDYNHSLVNRTESFSLHREIIAECQQQKEAEEKCERAYKRRGELMTQVEEIEVKLWEKLNHRKMAIVQIMWVSDTLKALSSVIIY